MKTPSPTVSRRDLLKVGGATLATLALQGALSDGLGLSAGLLSHIDLADAPAPALILKNGVVYTVDASFSMAQAVAIRDGLITAVGTDAAIEALAGPRTRIIDLEGRAVTPGLIDPHVHFRGIGLNTRYYVPFLPPEVNDIPSLQEAIEAVIETMEPGQWLMCYYLVLTEGTILTKEDLDGVSPDNPVFIMHIGGHWATANSAALTAAGITSSTPSPEGGIIEKGTDDEPTGVLYNHRAMDVVRQYAPPITYEVVRQATLATQDLMAACGVTSFQDNNIRELDYIRAYQELSQEGLLYLRNDLYLAIEWPSDMTRLGQVQRINNGVTRFAGCKFLIDGQAPTAYCHQPHNGAEYRLPTWDPATYKQAVSIVHNQGLQVCTHCIGDAAADLILEAYEEAMDANPRSDPRHRLEHAVLTTPQATQKMVDLGVVVSTNPAFIYMFGGGWESIFGTERMSRIMVTREWLDAGLHMTIGSDAPSTPYYNPGYTIAGAIGRTTFDKTVLGREQALTFDEALRAHTIEAAYAAHQENIKGSLEAGKLADIVVWTEDPKSITLAELASTTTVYMTFVGGRLVYPQSHNYLPFVQSA